MGDYPEYGAGLQFGLWVSRCYYLDMVDIQIRFDHGSSTSWIDWWRRYGDDGFIVCWCIYLSSSQALVRLDSLDSTSIRVRRETQQRRRVRSSPFPRIVLLRTSMYSTRPPRLAPEANSNRKEGALMVRSKHLCPPSIASTHVRSQSTSSLLCAENWYYPRSDRPYLASTPAVHWFIHNHIQHSSITSTQKAGIPTNPLSPLLFILSSNRLCDNVLSEDAVSFNAPYFRADVAPLLISSLRETTGEKAYNLSRMRRPLTWSIFPFIFSSRMRETTNPSASALVTFKD